MKPTPFVADALADGLVAQAEVADGADVALGEAAAGVRHVEHAVGTFGAVEAKRHLTVAAIRRVSVIAVLDELVQEAPAVLVHGLVRHALDAASEVRLAPGGEVGLNDVVGAAPQPVGGSVGRRDALRGDCHRAYLACHSAAVEAMFSGPRGT